MLVSRDWLKEYLGEDTPSAEKIADLLTFHAFEIESVEKEGNDEVIDVKILPNRGSDCLCHRGIARELASILGVELKHDPLKEPLAIKVSDKIVVEIEDKNATPRFTASLIRNVTVGESPEWLKERLMAIGQRPINNVVDATNYVMFAIGQPIHAYDADLFPQKDGRWQFGVRFAKAGEAVSLIAEGGKTEDRVVTLKGTEQLIIDNTSGTAAGLAGVKGGRFAGVHSGTKNVIIEAAHFDPAITRKTARALGIVIDASKRFENNPSIELPPYAQNEMAKLLGDIAGGVYEGTVDVYEKAAEPLPVKVSLKNTDALLGLNIDEETAIKILKDIGCEVKTTGVGLLCIPPWERTDLNIEEDFIEEIGRIYGYEHVKSVVPESVPLSEINVRHYYSEKIRDILVGLGFFEVITSSFRNKDEVQLQNALASDKSYIRSSLIKNITEVLDKNSNLNDLLGVADTRVFEVGTVFDKSTGEVSEHVSLCIGVRLKSSGYSGKEDKLLEEVIQKIEAEFNVSLSRKIEKGVAEINLTELLEKLPMPETYELVPKAKEIKYRPFSSYPFIARDIAMWVGEGVNYNDVEKILNETAGELRVRTTRFDEFKKEGRTSYAFRLVFQSLERTLTDSEVNTVMDSVYDVVKKQGWEVR